MASSAASQLGHAAAKSPSQRSMNASRSSRPRVGQVRPAVVMAVVADRRRPGRVEPEERVEEARRTCREEASVMARESTGSAGSARATIRPWRQTWVSRSR